MAKKKGGDGAKADVLPPLKKDPEVAEKEVEKLPGATAEERPSSPEEENAPTPGGRRRKSRKVRKSPKGRKGSKARKTRK